MADPADPFPLLHLASLDFDLSLEAIPLLPSYQLALAHLNPDWDPSLFASKVKQTWRKRREKARRDITNKAPMGVFAADEDKQREGTVWARFELVDLSFEVGEGKLEGLTSAQLAALPFHPKSTESLIEEASDIFFNRRERDFALDLSPPSLDTPAPPTSSAAPPPPAAASASTSPPPIIARAPGPASRLPPHRAPPPPPPPAALVPPSDSPADDTPLPFGLPGLSTTSRLPPGAGGLVASAAASGAEESGKSLKEREKEAHKKRKEEEEAREKDMDRKRDRGGKSLREREKEQYKKAKEAERSRDSHRRSRSRSREREKRRDSRSRERERKEDRGKDKRDSPIRSRSDRDRDRDRERDYRSSSDRDRDRERDRRRSRTPDRDRDRRRSRSPAPSSSSRRASASTATSYGPPPPSEPSSSSSMGRKRSRAAGEDEEDERQRRERELREKVRESRESRSRATSPARSEAASAASHSLRSSVRRRTDDYYSSFETPSRLPLLHRPRSPSPSSSSRRRSPSPPRHRERQGTPPPALPFPSDALPLALQSSLSVLFLRHFPHTVTEAQIASYLVSVFPAPPSLPGQTVPEPVGIKLHSTRMNPAPPGFGQAGAGGQACFAFVAYERRDDALKLMAVLNPRAYGSGGGGNGGRKKRFPDEGGAWEMTVSWANDTSKAVWRWSNFSPSFVEAWYQRELASFAVRHQQPKPSLPLPSSSLSGPPPPHSLSSVNALPPASSRLPHSSAQKVKQPQPGAVKLPEKLQRELVCLRVENIPEGATLGECRDFFDECDGLTGLSLTPPPPFSSQSGPIVWLAFSPDNEGRNPKFRRDNTKHRLFGGRFPNGRMKLWVATGEEWEGKTGRGHEWVWTEMSKDYRAQHAAEHQASLLVAGQPMSPTVSRLPPSTSNGGGVAGTEETYPPQVPASGYERDRTAELHHSAPYDANGDVRMRDMPPYQQQQQQPSGPAALGNGGRPGPPPSLAVPAPVIPATHQYPLPPVHYPPYSSQPFPPPPPPSHPYSAQPGGGMEYSPSQPQLGFPGAPSAPGGAGGGGPAAVFPPRPQAAFLDGQYGIPWRPATAAPVAVDGGATAMAPPVAGLPPAGMYAAQQAQQYAQQYAQQHQHQQQQQQQQQQQAFSQPSAMAGPPASGGGKINPAHLATIATTVDPLPASSTMDEPAPQQAERLDAATEKKLVQETQRNAWGARARTASGTPAAAPAPSTSSSSSSVPPPPPLPPTTTSYTTAADDFLTSIKLEPNPSSSSEPSSTSSSSFRTVDSRRPAMPRSSSTSTFNTSPASPPTARHPTSFSIEGIAGSPPSAPAAMLAAAGPSNNNAPPLASRLGGSALDHVAPLLPPGKAASLSLKASRENETAAEGMGTSLAQRLGLSNGSNGGATTLKTENESKPGMVELPINEAEAAVEVVKPVLWTPMSESPAQPAAVVKQEEGASAKEGGDSTPVSAAGTPPLDGLTAGQRRRAAEKLAHAARKEKEKQASEQQAATVAGEVNGEKDGGEGGGA
ncbi:hypothetical protein JCM8547_005796 [Rhodosporidiobolus lusitaniae]